MGMSCFSARKLLLHQCLELLDRQRTGEEIALGVVAAHLPQAFHLCLGFHTLRHGAQVHPFGQLHHKAHQAHFAGLGRLGLDELHIQLQNIKAHMAEHVQRGIAAAEIIHFDHKAPATQFVHHGDDLAGVFGIGALRQLQVELPLTESLKDTIARVIPYFQQAIAPQMEAGKHILIAAHGNSLRAMVMYFDHLSQEAITGVNIPTGVPLVYEFDDSGNALRHYYLGDAAAIEAKMNAVAAQGKAK